MISFSFAVDVYTSLSQDYGNKFDRMFLLQSLVSRLSERLHYLNLRDWCDWICLNMSECTYKKKILNMPWVLIMPKFWLWQSSEYAEFSISESYTGFWICQNMSWQSSQCILCSKYARILKMAGFWICRSYTGL